MKKIKLLLLSGITLAVITTSTGLGVYFANANKYKLSDSNIFNYEYKNQFIKNFNSKQITEISKNVQVFNLFENNEQIEYDNLAFINEKIVFSTKNKTIVLNPNSSMNKENKEKINLNDLFISYDFSKMQNDAFYLSDIKKKKYNNQLFVPDLQIIIDNILSSKNYLNTFYPNWINIESIRNIGWINNQEQKIYIENLIKIYLLALNTGQIDFIVKINNSKIINNSVQFNLDILDAENNSLIDEKNKEINFYINNFLDYKKSSVIGINFDNNDKEILFNEYLNFPVLKFKQNPWNWSNYDNLVDGVELLEEKYSAKSFKSLLKKNKDLLYIEVPKD
ncbi:MAG3240 family lipoprotein, partial [Mycoplasmopsis alligatoris]